MKEFTYFTTLYAPLPSPTLRVVEIPDDTVPSAWAPRNGGDREPRDYASKIELSLARQYGRAPVVGRVRESGVAG